MKKYFANKVDILLFFSYIAVWIFFDLEKTWIIVLPYMLYNIIQKGLASKHLNLEQWKERK